MFNNKKKKVECGKQLVKRKETCECFEVVLETPNGLLVCSATPTCSEG